jgi:hypothetical protein
MGKSFYCTRSYDQLRNGSQVFSDLINAGATSYGLTTLQATSYQTLHDDYVTKFLLAEAPATRTKGTILARNDAADLLRDKAAELAKIVEATPTVTNEQRADLGLSVRKTPEPMGPPGTCSNFKVKLLADGSIDMTWRANNPPGCTGVTYQVWRRFGSEGEFAYAGATGLKQYIDADIPAGTQQVQYQVRGIRPTAAGAWAQYNVNFGKSSATGAMMASGVETMAEPKLAA